MRYLGTRHARLRLWISLFARGLILGSLAVGAWVGLNALPDAINPFSPVELTDDVGPLTNLKLRLLQSRYEACLATIKRRSVAIERKVIAPTKEGCGMEKGIVLKQSPRVPDGFVGNGGDLDMTCGLGAALLIWERNIVVPQAQMLLGSPVTRVRTFGTYDCRNINHAKTGRLSAHAEGRAIDISGFDLKDGRKISVVKDWGKATPEGQFLKVTHEGACSVFNVVLGPDFNDLHKNHFHLDMSIWRICK
ncbi:MAG: extensin family protein [Pseudomonadota bacterium]